MANKLSTRDYGIDLSTIPDEIEDIYNSFSKNRKDGLERYYGSAYDFLVILYYLRFVLKLDKVEIAKKLGILSEDVYIHLYNFGWDYSSDYEENKKIFNSKLSEWKEALSRALSEAPGLDLDKHGRLKFALENAKKLFKKSYLPLNFSSGEEYARVIYYLLHVEKLSPVSIMHLFHLSYGNVHHRIRNLGLNMSREEVENRKKQKRMQGFEKRFSGGPKKRLTAQLRKYSASASENVEYVRSQLSNSIYDYVDEKKYEIIVGVSNIGLLGSLEVDIPIIIRDVENDRYHRIDVEYNANFFHTIEPNTVIEGADVSKVCQLKPTFEDPGERNNDNQEILDILAQEFYEYIQSKIE